MVENPTPNLPKPIAGGSAAAVPALAIELLPLLPGLIESVTNIVERIQQHATTPDQAKAQLAEVMTHLDSAAAKVAAVQIV
jgi:hypothetical protein